MLDPAHGFRSQVFELGDGGVVVSRVEKDTDLGVIRLFTNDLRRAQALDERSPVELQPNDDIEVFDRLRERP